MAIVFRSWRDITYEKVGNAGEGGIGKVAVTLAITGPHKGVLFAIKEFSPGSRVKEEWKQAFMREAHVLRDCDHPAIVRVFDEGVLQGGRPFFVMEYLPTTLWGAMQEGKLDDLTKVSIVMQLLSALDYLSRRDPYIVHRDIKPKNIFLKAETCVLGDFGLIFQDVEHAQPSGSGVPAMAQMYRTPELVAFHNGGPKPPPRSDVFQLGLVAAELFTGKNPLRPAGAAKPIQLDPLASIPGALGQVIRTRLEEMLVVDTKSRWPASRLLPLWLDLYRTLIRRQDDERRAARLAQRQVIEPPPPPPAPPSAAIPAPDASAVEKADEPPAAPNPSEPDVRPG
jgi:serine/threonine protein kinase